MVIESGQIAAFGTKDEVAKASGKVIPSKQIQSIQNLEGGILKELKVREGQIVQKGDVIAVLDDTLAASSFGEQKSKHTQTTCIFRLIGYTSPNKSNKTYQ